MDGIVNITESDIVGSDKEKTIILKIRCKNNMGGKGGVYKRVGPEVTEFLKVLYSIEEIKDTNGMTFTKDLD